MFSNKELDENYFLVENRSFSSDDLLFFFRLDSKGIPRTVTTKTLKKRRPASRPLAQILRTTDNNFIDFIRRCFEYV